MKTILIGITVQILTALIFLGIGLPPFIAGSFSCTAFYVTRDILEK